MGGRSILIADLTVKTAEFDGAGKDGDSKPGLILIKYRDGLKFSMLLIPNVIVPGETTHFSLSFPFLMNIDDLPRQARDKTKRKKTSKQSVLQTQTLHASPSPATTARVDTAPTPRAPPPARATAASFSSSRTPATATFRTWRRT